MVELQTIRWFGPPAEIPVEVTCTNVRDACATGPTVYLAAPGTDYAAELRRAVQALKLAALVPRTAAPRFARVAAHLRPLTLGPADAAFNADLVVAIGRHALERMDAVLAIRGLGPLRPV